MEEINTQLSIQLLDQLEEEFNAQPGQLSIQLMLSSQLEEVSNAQLSGQLEEELNEQPGETHYIPSTSQTHSSQDRTAAKPELLSESSCQARTAIKPEQLSRKRREE